MSNIFNKYEYLYKIAPFTDRYTFQSLCNSYKSIKDNIKKNTVLYKLVKPEAYYKGPLEIDGMMYNVDVYMTFNGNLLHSYNNKPSFVLEGKCGNRSLKITMYHRYGINCGNKLNIECSLDNEVYKYTSFISSHNKYKPQEVRMFYIIKCVECDLLLKMFPKDSYWYMFNDFKFDFALCRHIVTDENDLYYIQEIRDGKRDKIKVWMYGEVIYSLANIGLYNVAGMHLNYQTHNLIHELIRNDVDIYI